MLQKRVVKVFKTIIMLLLIAVVFNGCSSISKKPTVEQLKSKDAEFWLTMGSKNYDEGD